MIRPFIAALALALVLTGVASARPGAGPMRGACKADVRALCIGVQPGGGRIAQCLRQHQDRVSAACNTASAQVAAMRRAGRRQSGNPANPAPASAPN